MISTSVVICAYTEERWDDLVAAVDSVRKQVVPAAELIVVIDHNADLFERAHRELPATVVESRGVPGLSDARNTGVAEATGEVVAFLDDDAVAHPDWLGALTRAFEDPRTLGVGGAIEPAWVDAPPRAFPDEFLWVVGCSYRGLPATATEVRNFLGASMSFRRSVFAECGGFRSELGRVAGRPAGCEETEFCIRVRASHPAGRLVYEPSARVSHRVPGTRATWKYFRSRCYHEGRSKAIVASLAGNDRALATERTYASRVLPAGVARGLAATAGGDVAGLGRALAIVVGLVVTVVGFSTGAVALRVRSPKRRFAVGETWRTGAASGEHAGMPGSWVDFDVHGRVGIRVDATAPTRSLLDEMLEGFATSEPLPATHITVTGDGAELAEPSRAEDAFQYTEGGLVLAGGAVSLVVERSGIQLSGKGELLTTLLPVLDWMATERGAPMVHAATFEVDGVGVCMGAWGGAGKTSTVAKFLRRDGASFMGDDWAFLTSDGQLLGFAKPMFMKAHHRAIYPELFATKRKPLVPRQLTRPLNRVATAVHPIITRYPKLARVTRKWSPEHWVVSPRTVFGADRISGSAPLGLAVFMERHHGSTTTVEERSAAWMASRLVANFHAEMTRYSQDVLTALGAASIRPLDGHLGAKATHLASGLTGVPCHLLRVPVALSADEASDVIVDEITALLSAAASGPGPSAGE